MQNKYEKILQRRANSETPLPKIKIKTLFDLKRLVERLKPTNSKDSTLTVSFEKVDTPTGQVPQLPVSMENSGESMERRLLIDGFDLLKRQREYKQSAKIYEEDVDSFGGFFPAVPVEAESKGSWVDRFITDHLDGRREGLFVFWDLSEGTFRLDPWSCVLEQVRA